MQERTADKFVHRMEERVHVAGDVRSSTTLRARTMKRPTSITLNAIARDGGILKKETMEMKEIIWLQL